VLIGIQEGFHLQAGASARSSDRVTTVSRFTASVSSLLVHLPLDRASCEPIFEGYHEFLLFGVEGNHQAPV
jgi:hypothetical protein